MPTITKKELTDRIAETMSIKHTTVKTVVHQFLDEIISELAKGNRLEFRDFGVFEVRERAARVAQNPKTLERVKVSPKRVVKFKMGRVMREGMNGKGTKRSGALAVRISRLPTSAILHVKALPKATQLAHRPVGLSLTVKHCPGCSLLATLYNNKIEDGHATKTAGCARSKTSGVGERNLNMARNEAKRQKKLMKKRQKDKLRKKRQVESIPYTVLSTKKKIHLARHYPLYECLINPSWEEKGLATIVVSRRQPDEDLIFGVYLVDVLCLGLKNTFCNADFPLSRYNRDLVQQVYRYEEPIPCSSGMAHQIIYGAIAFARRFGFHPHRDFNLSQYVLEEPGSLEEAPQVKFGRDGKPFYISGPDDDVPRILRQLESTAGQGHFDYMYGGPAPDPYLPNYPGQTARRIE